jgi:hypothetical protein
MHAEVLMSNRRAKLHLKAEIVPPDLHYAYGSGRCRQLVQQQHT